MRVCRQKLAWMWSRSGVISECICHNQESCTAKAIDLPAPYRWNASTTRSSGVVNNVVAPGFTSLMGLTTVTGGSLLQRSSDASSVSAIKVDGCEAPARVV